jgi:hypothetical protein
LFADVTSSQVLAKRVSGWMGSNASPSGAPPNPDAKSSISGVFWPPTGKPVAGSIRMRQISRSTKLV